MHLQSTIRITDVPQAINVCSISCLYWSLSHKHPPELLLLVVGHPPPLIPDPLVAFVTDDQVFAALPLTTLAGREGVRTMRTL